MSFAENHGVFGIYSSILDQYRFALAIVPRGMSDFICEMSTPVRDFIASCHVFGSRVAECQPEVLCTSKRATPFFKEKFSMS